MKRMAAKAMFGLGLALASLSSGAPARAEAAQNVALTLSSSAAADANPGEYDERGANLVTVTVPGVKLTKLQGKVPTERTCPQNVGVICYDLALAPGDFSGTPPTASVTFEVDASGTATQASKTLPKKALAPAPPPPDKAMAPATSPLEEAFTRAVMLTGVSKTGSAESFYDRGKDVAVLLFDEEGAPIDAHPVVDEDDRIFVVVAAYKNPGARIKSARVVTCDAPDPVRIGGTSLGQAGGRAAGAPQKNDFPAYQVVQARSCSSDTGVTVAVTSIDDTAEISTNIKVRTIPLYRLTVGIGVVMDFTRTNEFEAKAVKGESVPVIVKDRHAQGLQPLAMVTFRPVPVDMERIREWWFIPSPTVGVNLAHPLDHVYAGLHLDPWPGLGAVAGFHFMREEKLAGGYTVGDRVPGGDVATDKRWKKFNAGDFFVGLNLDAAIVAKLIGSLSQ